MAQMKGRGAGTPPARTVVVVNGNPDVLGTLEATLEAGRYDMVFVDSSDGAYAQIRRVLPHLVILCTSLDDARGFQLLTMLKLDEQTRNIPVVTYAIEGDDQDADDAVAPWADEDDTFLPRRRELRMN